MTMIRPFLIPALAVLAGVAGLEPALAQALHTIDAATAPTGPYRVDKARSSVVLRISHAGLSYAVMRVDRFDGTLDYDPAHPEQSRLQVTLDAASLDSGDPALDKLVSTQLLEAARYPQIQFTATQIKPTIEGRAQVHGELTLHGQTRPVDLDVLMNGAAQGDDRTTRLGFSATTTFSRSDFKIAPLAALSGDEVSVDIEVEFQH
jgi:polyisoprenoid-binding protein YceI